eukprot:PhM_4_TR4136/c0_g1_i1/m.69883
MHLRNVDGGVAVHLVVDRVDALRRRQGHLLPLRMHLLHVCLGVGLDVDEAVCGRPLRRRNDRRDARQCRHNDVAVLEDLLERAGRLDRRHLHRGVAGVGLCEDVDLGVRQKGAHNVAVLERGVVHRLHRNVEGREATEERLLNVRVDGLSAQQQLDALGVVVEHGVVQRGHALRVLHVDEVGGRSREEHGHHRLVAEAHGVVQRSPLVVVGARHAAPRAQQTVQRLVIVGVETPDQGRGRRRRARVGQLHHDVEVTRGAVLGQDRRQRIPGAVAQRRRCHREEVRREREAAGTVRGIPVDAATAEVREECLAHDRRGLAQNLVERRHVMLGALAGFIDGGEHKLDVVEEVVQEL